jgi:hypothetical protein
VENPVIVGTIFPTIGIIITSTGVAFGLLEEEEKEQKHHHHHQEQA